MPVIALYTVALLAELAGLALAADGLRRTWRDFRRPEDAFWAPVSVPTKAAAGGAYVRVRRLIGRPVPPVDVRVVTATATALGMATSVDFVGTIVPPVGNTKAYIEYLSRRLDDLSGQIRHVESRIQADTDANVQRFADATKAIGEVRDEVHGQMRTITIKGLREQALGWVLIVAGTFLGGVGNLIGAS